METAVILGLTARLSLGSTVVFFALLTMLHILEPEFNAGHVISEYQLGHYGVLMSLAFGLLGTSAVLLALSLRPRSSREADALAGGD